MPSKLVIIGTGFAGLWSAFSAKRLAKLSNRENDIEIIVIAPKPSLVVRPRLYEANASNMTVSLEPLFKEAAITFIQGTVTTINPEANTLLVNSTTTESTLTYDRLILAAGSSVIRPKSVTGINEHAFDVDSLDGAVKLEAHLNNLPSLPASPARDTIVVCGAGFTGLEIATELPKRVAPDTKIIIVDSADKLGNGLGPGPRPIITQALEELNIEYKLGSPVASITADAVTLTSGETINTKTAIWTAGVRATPLTQQIPAPKDPLGRLSVDTNLRVPSFPKIFATGDAAHAATDTLGHYAMMSCQHALPMGRYSGHNAVADLLGEPLVPYTQSSYGVCLDLGAWGTVICQGWEREVRMTGEVAKKVKGYINQKLIYPPGGLAEALEAAGPGELDFEELAKGILQIVA